ncbi:MAG: phosphatase [Lachnospiraceae bacterium]|nr:phosphatase [Lachnospiraceae bacterium]
MKYLMDLHTHSLASGHAYSTIREMAYMASERGLEILGITEHAPAMHGSCRELYFSNLYMVPRNMCGVNLLFGAELNILDFDGNVDISEPVLDKLDICIASLHIPCIKPGKKEDNTRAYINAMKNRHVNIIGHPDDDRYPVDYDALVYEAKRQHVLIEMNNASLNPNGARKGARELDFKILEKCVEYRQPVIVGSDAHIDVDVGNFERMDELLKEFDFPEELIINDSVDKLKAYLDRR